MHFQIFEGRNTCFLTHFGIVCFTILNLLYNSVCKKRVSLIHNRCLEVEALTKLKTSTMQFLGRSPGNCRREAVALFDWKGTSGTPVEMQQSKFLLVSAQAMPPFSQSHTLQPLNYLSQKKTTRSQERQLLCAHISGQTKRYHGNM